ncbi:MAG: hypothetical protein AAF557_00470 [Pseudomonadota bacterium]
MRLFRAQNRMRVRHRQDFPKDRLEWIPGRPDRDGKSHKPNRSRRATMRPETFMF